VAYADAELVGELRDAASIERAGGNAMRSDMRESRDSVDERSTRCELGPAPQTRPKARAFRGRGGVEEPAMVRIRDARGTNGAAVYARRRDADEEEPVEPWISRA
jgi:hypothetical protein